MSVAENPGAQMLAAGSWKVPGAHSTISAAGADVLTSFYGNEQHFSLTSPALPGVTCSFGSLLPAHDPAGK
jgi:hypothetical protein